MSDDEYTKRQVFNKCDYTRIINFDKKNKIKNK
jgi:hypothetical protein